MPSDRAWKALNAVHRTLWKVSRGRIGGTGYGMPVVELTTRGRKTGLPRSVMLTSQRQEGETIVLVASRGGADAHPDWLLNVRANPEVTVAFRGAAAQPMRARVASPEERARLWPLVVADHPNYAEYQEKTDREIPVVVLERV